MTFLYDGDKIGAGVSRPLCQLELYSEIIWYFPDTVACLLPKLVLLPNHFEVFGHTYELGTVLLSRWEPLLYPEFVRVRTLVVVNGNKFMICEKLRVEEYAVDLGGFLAMPTCELILLKTCDLKYCIPQIVHQYCGFIGIILQGAGDIFML